MAGVVSREWARGWVLNWRGKGAPGFGGGIVLRRALDFFGVGWFWWVCVCFRVDSVRGWLVAQDHRAELNPYICHR